IRYREQSDFGRGVVRQTENPLDIALDGSSDGNPYWLRVQNGAGQEFYTRNGQLQIGKDGRLTNNDGLAVLDANGAPVLLPVGEEAPREVRISPNGQVQD